MTVLSIFQWLSHSAVGTYMQKSQWAFAIVETFHLLALAALGGEVLLLNLSLLGIPRRWSPHTILRELFPSLIVSLVTMIVTGVLMLSEEAMKCYYSQGFRGKMIALFLAVAFSFPLYLSVRRIQEGKVPLWLKGGAILSLFLWLSVGLAGRAIGFL